MDISDFFKSEIDFTSPEARYAATITSDWSAASSSPLADIQEWRDLYANQLYRPQQWVVSKHQYDIIDLWFRLTRIDIPWDSALFPRTTRLARRIRSVRSRLHYRYLDWKHRNDPGYF